MIENMPRRFLKYLSFKCYGEYPVQVYILQLDIGFAADKLIHRTVEVMLWGATTYDMYFVFLFIRCGMTAPRNVEDLQQTILFPNPDGHPHAHFQQNKARPIIALRTINLINATPRLFHLPDLNLSVDAWNMTERRIFW